MASVSNPVSLESCFSSRHSAKTMISYSQEVFIMTDFTINLISYSGARRVRYACRQGSMRQIEA